MQAGADERREELPKSQPRASGSRGSERPGKQAVPNGHPGAADRTQAIADIDVATNPGPESADTAPEPEPTNEADFTPENGANEANFIPENGANEANFQSPTGVPDPENGANEAN